jgi:ATP-dependent Zn protease
MDDTNGLTPVLPRFDLGPMIEIRATPAASRHISAWTLDQHVMALHEAGHAGVAALLHIPVRSIDITGRFSGETKFASADNDQMPLTLTQSQVRAHLVVMLSGLATEIAVLGQPTLGSEDDIRRATIQAMGMFNAGMAGPDRVWISMSPFQYRENTPPVSLLEEFYDYVREELGTAQRRAIEIVGANVAGITALAERIVRERELTGSALDAALRESGLL